MSEEDPSEPIAEEIITQHEYNRRRDVMAEEQYRNRYYDQMRRLDEILEEQRHNSIKRYKIKINPPFWMKIKMFFQSVFLKLIFTK